MTAEWTHTAPCSSISAMSGEDPIGTAPTHERYLFVEIPLPWAYPITMSQQMPKQLVNVLDEAAERGQKIRFLAFSSDERTSPTGYRRIFYFTKPETAFARYMKHEFVVPENEVVGLVQKLISSAPLDSFNEHKQDTLHIRDLFVCTHGSHDRCCGMFGYEIYQRLVKEYASLDHFRVWRVSHLGGHRFAPTMLDMPEGRYWARIAADDLDILVRRSGPFSALASKYRGWGGVGKFEQFLEREIGVREGWDWIGYMKSGRSVAMEDGTVHVTIDYTSADGTITGRYEGKVMPSHIAKVGGCGKPLEEVQMYKLVDAVKLA